MTGLTPLSPNATTRERIIDAALRLFGEVGYTRASIAKIEEAAGLSPGAGGLYRHFKTKEELLVEAVRTCLDDWGPFAQFAEPGFSAAPLIDAVMPEAPLSEKVSELCRIGLIRADHVRDATRVVLRDNSVPLGVLDAFRDRNREIIIGLTERTLRDLAGDADGRFSWRPLAEIIAGAISHLWLMQDIYGENPSGIDVDAYIQAVGESAAALVEAKTRP